MSVRHNNTISKKNDLQKSTMTTDSLRNIIGTVSKKKKKKKKKNAFLSPLFSSNSLPFTAIFWTFLQLKVLFIVVLADSKTEMK